MPEVKTMSGPESDEGRGVYLPLQGFALGKGQRGLQSIPEAPSLWAESERWKGGARVRRACRASRSWRSWPLGPRSLGHSLGARLPLLPDSPMGPELRAGRPPNQPLLCICRLGGSSPAYTVESGCRVPVPARPAWPPPAPVHLPGPQLFFQWGCTRPQTCVFPESIASATAVDHVID